MSGNNASASERTRDVPVDLETGDFVFPGWWVRAFAAANCASDSPANSWEMIRASGIAPALNPAEMAMLGSVLAGLQSRLLRDGVSTQSGGSSRLRVSVSDFERLSGVRTPAGRAQLDRLLTLLPALRVLGEDHPPISNSAGSSAEEGKPYKDAHPLFLRDAWGQSAGDPSIELVGSERLPELLFGLEDSSVALLREMRLQMDSVPKVGWFADPPLVALPAMWLELSAAEQAVYLRLERAMQWETRWLQLDGVFGVGLDVLTESLPRSASRREAADAPMTALASRLRVLGKLGRRLVEQGVLARAAGQEQGMGQYLAFGNAGEGPNQQDESFEQSPSVPQLIWRATPETLQRRSLEQHIGRAGAVFREALVSPALDELAAMLGAKSTQSEAIACVAKTFAEAGRKSGSSDPLAGTVLQMSASGRIVQGAVLFLEWIVRQDRRHELPLPPSLAAMPAVTELAKPGPVAEKLTRFLAGISAERARFTELLGQSGASVFAPASRSKSSFGTWYETARSRLQREALSIGSRLASEGGTRRIAADRGGVAEAGRSADHAVLAGTEVASQRTNRIQSPAGQLAAQAAMRSRMRKTASEELAKIKSSDPEHYGELKRSYIGSLDEASRKIILEVQSRMLPQLFDEHLRQRLVRFMVDNPMAWSSPADTRTVIGETWRPSAQ